jgi:transposase-like protein
MRCTSCGTTWFDQLTTYVRGLQRSCHRCGGELHAERRSVAAARAVRAA